MGVILPLLKHLSLQKDVRHVLYERFHMPEWFQKHGIPPSDQIPWVFEDHMQCCIGAMVGSGALICPNSFRGRFVHYLIVRCDNLSRTLVDLVNTNSAISASVIYIDIVRIVFFGQKKLVLICCCNCCIVVIFLSTVESKLMDIITSPKKEENIEDSLCHNTLVVWESIHWPEVILLR